MKSVEKKNKKLLCLAILLSFVLVVGIFSIVFVVKKWDNRDEAVADGSTATQSTSELAEDKPGVAPVSTETLAANTTEEKKTTEEKSTEAQAESSTSTSRDTEDPDDDFETSGNTGGNTSNSSGNTSGNNTGNNTGNNSGNTSGNTSGNSTNNSSNDSGNTNGNASGNNSGNSSGNNGGNTTEATTEATTESDEPSYGDLVWVVDREARWVEVPVYETVYLSICNGCGADITGNTEHTAIPENIRNGCGGYHLETRAVQTGTELVYEEEQGHWECPSWN